MKTFKTLLLFLFVLFAFTTSAQWATSGNDIYNTNSGNVGIATSSPTSLLHAAKSMVEPKITVQNLGEFGGATFEMIDDNQSGHWKFKSKWGGGFKIRDHASSLDVIVIDKNSAANQIYIAAGGGIGIGTNTIPTGYQMAIDGKLIAEELEVQLSGDWPDYVFRDDYNLPTLYELEQFINQNGHLPNVPSAEEIENGTLKVGEMNTILMQKVEELTLYVIELKKEIEELKKNQ